jgi:CRP-like cAMP-binding protein
MADRSALAASFGGALSDDPDITTLLDDTVSIVKLQPGEVLFKEGDESTSMYIVRRGALSIRSGSVVYEDVGPGGIIGEMGIVERLMPRSAMVYALTDSELLEISERQFLHLIEQAPGFALTVMRVLSRRLRRMDGKYQVGRSEF